MRWRHAFTLVELLVVIAVIAILVALLMPAVQAAREAARKVQCANHQKQVALAVSNYSGTHSRMPAIVDAAYQEDDGLGYSDASWRLTILPFLEAQALWDQLNDPATWKFGHAKIESNPTARRAIVTEYLCPSTTPHPATLPDLKVLRNDDSVLFDKLGVFHNYSPFLGLATDANREYLCAWYGLATNYGSAFRGNVHGQARNQGAKLVYIADGLSRTMLLLERGGLPLRYSRGRLTNNTPYGWGTHFFGGEEGTGGLVAQVNRHNQGGLFSLHPGGAHATFCDGSVHFVSEDTSKEVLDRLLNRNDAQRTGKAD